MEEEKSDAALLMDPNLVSDNEYPIPSPSSPKQDDTIDRPGLISKHCSEPLLDLDYFPTNSTHSKRSQSGGSAARELGHLLHTEIAKRSNLVHPLPDQDSTQSEDPSTTNTEGWADNDQQLHTPEHKVSTSQPSLKGFNTHRDSPPPSYSRTMSASSVINRHNRVGPSVERVKSAPKYTDKSRLRSPDFWVKEDALDNDSPVSSYSNSPVTSTQRLLTTHSPTRRWQNKVAPSEQDLDETRSTTPDAAVFIGQTYKGKPGQSSHCVPVEETTGEKVVDIEVHDEQLSPRQSLGDGADSSLDSLSSFQRPPQGDIEHLPYIPFHCAQAALTVVVNDMKKMKSRHVEIVDQIQNSYNDIEQHSQVQYQGFVQKLKEQHGSKVTIYKQVVKVLQEELENMKQYWEGTAQSLSHCNKELLEENRSLYQKVKDTLEKTQVEKERTTTCYTKRLDKEKIKHSREMQNARDTIHQFHAKCKQRILLIEQTSSEQLSQERTTHAQTLQAMEKELTTNEQKLNEVTNMYELKLQEMINRKSTTFKQTEDIVPPTTPTSKVEPLQRAAALEHELSTVSLSTGLEQESVEQKDVQLAAQVDIDSNAPAVSELDKDAEQELTKNEEKSPEESHEGMLSEENQEATAVSMIEKMDTKDINKGSEEEVTVKVEANKSDKEEDDSHKPEEMVEQMIDMDKEIEAIGESQLQDEQPDITNEMGESQEEIKQLEKRGEDGTEQLEEKDREIDQEEEKVEQIEQVHLDNDDEEESSDLELEEDDEGEQNEDVREEAVKLNEEVVLQPNEEEAEQFDEEVEESREGKLAPTDQTRADKTQKKTQMQQSGKAIDPKLQQDYKKLKAQVFELKKQHQADLGKLKALEKEAARGNKGGSVEDKRELKKKDKELKDAQKQYETAKNNLSKIQVQLKTADTELTTLRKDHEKLIEEAKLKEGEFKKMSSAAKEGEAAIERANQLQGEVKKQTEEMKKLSESFNSERILRKKYYNLIEDMKGKIRVYCRVRPLSSSEKERNDKPVVESPDEYSVHVRTARGVKEFQFDQIFTPEHSQERVFDDTKNLIQSAVDGYNVCIFAYGQTGSGKTYTMIGGKDSKGVINSPGIAPRAFDEVFNIMEANRDKYTFNVSCYMMELYNEKLIDLFHTKGKEPAKLDIKKDKKGMVAVNGSISHTVENASSLMALFEFGSKSRHISSTKMNAESSRSHLVIGVIIESTNKTNGTVHRGKLSIVDLAGSERASKTGATPEQLKEAQSINKSLSALGDVISALSSGQDFIPYRNNKLTMLMQDSLGGNAKTLMFVNISPADYNSDETITSLTYAARVKLITNDASKNADNKEIARLKGVIAKMKKGENIDEDEV